MDSFGAFHGGEFWNAIGREFPSNFANSGVINADVLDAWFPPAPGVIKAFEDHAGWLARTAPPIQAEGLRKTIAYVKSLPEESILLGAGSSDLLYRVLPKWLGMRSRVLLPEPCYGEYAHLIENVIGAYVDRIECPNGLDLIEWRARLRGDHFDLAVLVNPNNPTGEILTASRLIEAIRNVKTRVLIDEAYADFLFPSPTLERWAGPMPNLFVLKSLSKAYALSGCRVGYMVGATDELQWFREMTPPWNVGTFAQLAAIRALQDPEYYEGRYAETQALRRDFSCKLRARGYEVREGINWVLVRVNHAAALVQEMSERGIYLRDAGRSAPSLGHQWVRITIRDGESMVRILSALDE